jgi:putative acetyltransferase
MIIRQERPEDFPEIYELVRIAFQTAKVSNGKDFVDQLRSGGKYIPELALVAEEDNKLVGHIMLTEAHISNGRDTFTSLFLAPISVVLEDRNKGIGSSLINASFRLAREMGYTSVLLVGDPAYYNRFGFRAAINFGIKHMLDIPDENVMACELVPQALDEVSGTMDCC